MEDWDEIRGFESPGEYERFSAWISAAVFEGVLQEVPISSRYAEATVFEERWYRTAKGQIWRLVAPDYPFRGVFEKVDSGANVKDDPPREDRQHP